MPAAERLPGPPTAPAAAPEPKSTAVMLQEEVGVEVEEATAGAAAEAGAPP